MAQHHPHLVHPNGMVGPPPPGALHPRIQGKKHRHEDEEQGKLFVGGLSWDTAQESLLAYFGQFGEVIDCVVMKNLESGRSRGFGFVTFADPANIDAVLASSPHHLDGRTIDPKACNPRSMQKPKKSNVQYFPKVFLGGLPPNITETDLRSFFSHYGEVIEVVIMYDQEKKKSRGFGFLSFADDVACSKAVSEHYVMIKDKQVEVKRAEPRTNPVSHNGTKMQSVDQWGMPPQASPTPNGHAAPAPAGFSGWGAPPGAPPAPATAYPAQYTSPQPPTHAHHWGPGPPQHGAPPQWAPHQTHYAPPASAPPSHVPHQPGYPVYQAPTTPQPAPPSAPPPHHSYWSSPGHPQPPPPTHDPYGPKPAEYHHSPYAQPQQQQPHSYPFAPQQPKMPQPGQAYHPQPGSGHPEFYPHATSPPGPYGTQPPTDLTASLGPQRGGAVYATQQSPYHPYRRS